MQTIVWRLDFFALVECRQTVPYWTMYIKQLAEHRSSEQTDLTGSFDGHFFHLFHHRVCTRPLKIDGLKNQQGDK
jgi:hypothetical protein